MKRKVYTDDFRANAVLMFEAAGGFDERGALTRVARHLAIPWRTLSRWAHKEQNPPPDQLVHIKRGTMVEQIDNLAEKILAAMDREIDADSAPLKDLGVVFGILTDKSRLLKGESTENKAINVTTISEDERARRLAAITSELDT